MPQGLREQAKILADRPYIINSEPDETTDGQPAFIARVLELQGCFGSGPTQKDAENDARSAMVDFIESLLEDGVEVPEPITLLPVSHSSGNRSVVLIRVAPAKSPPDKDDVDRPAHLRLVPATA